MQTSRNQLLIDALHAASLLEKYHQEGFSVKRGSPLQFGHFILGWMARDLSQIKVWFMSKVEKGEGCWIWRGRIQNGGYGSVSIYTHPFLAHRVSYNLFVGVIPDEMDLCHRCDNPACVRPDHLFIGTTSDNMMDCTRKNRNRKKLNPLQVRIIRRVRASHEKIASVFGVSRRLIGMIKRREVSAWV